ncbi:MAG: helix-turn-helix domain-containing protein [Oscillospiraceae bacterium]|nr:helix-turn-helix domain-containing protein [Oscillospiraceae bacterium]
MDIVQNINNYIENTPYTLTELERICGFPKSSMRKWSENIPSISKVAKVAEALNVSLDCLYYGKEKSSPAELSEEEQECIEKFNRLTDIDKGRIIERMDVMFSEYPPEAKESVS